MNAMPLISIIVPVYNVEKYLPECISSILMQTYRNYELILVDDGATDHSGIMCDEYAASDDRIKVVHKENGGLSDARNAGIKLATGEYLTFIDSDDMICADFLQKMIQTAVTEQVEVVQGRFVHDRNLLGRTNGDVSRIYRDSEGVMKAYLCFQNLEGYAWNKLYATHLFKTLRYPVGKIQEDAWTTYKALYEADGVAVIDENTYMYRINNSSIMNGNFRAQRFEIMKVPENIRSYLNCNCDAVDYEKELSYYTMRIGFKTYNDCLMKGCDRKYQNEMINLRNIITKLSIDRNLWGKKYIIMTRILSLSATVYRAVIRMSRKRK